MLVIRSEDEVRKVLFEERKCGKRIGLVPTMGALHQGHLSLVEVLKPHCDYVVMWVFLNPVQFNSKADYERYPTDLERDVELARDAGVDLVFAPELEEIYPRGLDAYYEQKSCRVFAGDCSEGLCGAGRPGHFDGVAHVVCLFFNILRPDVAVFGEKDYQQVRVVQQLVDDLHMGVELITAPILREESGLALSSRNQLLTEKREASLSISRALIKARDAVASGETSVEKLHNLLSSEMRAAGLEIEYIELRHTETLEPLDVLSDQAQLLVAAFAGEVRLIDNMRLLVGEKRS